MSNISHVLKIGRVVPVYKPKLRVGKKIGAYLIPENKDFDEIQVSIEYYEKYQPKAGGYYIVNNDGSETWSLKI